MHTDNPNHEIAHELIALEQRLAAWRPASGSLDRDRMLYDAGRLAAQAEGHVRFWRLATAGCVVLSLGLGGLLVRERSQRLTHEMTLASQTGTITPSPSMPPLAVEAPALQLERLGPTSYFALSSQIVRSGGDIAAPDSEVKPEPDRPGIRPSQASPNSATWRPRDLQRLLEL